MLRLRRGRAPLQPPQPGSRPAPGHPQAAAVQVHRPACAARRRSPVNCGKAFHRQQAAQERCACVGPWVLRHTPIACPRRRPAGEPVRPGPRPRGPSTWREPDRSPVTSPAVTRLTEFERRHGATGQTLRQPMPVPGGIIRPAPPRPETRCPAGRPSGPLTSPPSPRSPGRARARAPGPRTMPSAQRRPQSRPACERPGGAARWSGPGFPGACAAKAERPPARP